VDRGEAVVSDRPSDGGAHAWQPEGADPTKRQPEGMPQPGSAHHVERQQQPAADERLAYEPPETVADPAEKGLIADPHEEAPWRIVEGEHSHGPRQTDVDPRAAKRAERQVAALFALSALATVGFVLAYVLIDLDSINSLVWSNRLLGVALALALFCIGAGAIHWAKKLMGDDEYVQSRHELRSTAEEREDFVDSFRRGTDDSGFTRRSLIRRSLVGAMALLPINAVILLWDLAEEKPGGPGGGLRETLWAPGVPIVTAVTGEHVRPEDLSIGALVNAEPENLEEIPEGPPRLNALADSAIILVRMEPAEIVSQQGADWDYQGILAFSKICTHVGCPISLYEQETHHLLCPCHQSTYDLADSARVVFGPAARSLPQLAITVDEGGYLVARQDFAALVGPSTWEPP
jgi:ubiquinol-cytochrome c reductase iron-sulfur subunit